MASPHWAFIHPFQLRLQRGIEVYLWELSSALSKRGVEVDILTWAGPLEAPNYVAPSVRVKPVASVRYYQHLVAIPYYLWHIAQNHYDHVFVQFAAYGEGPALNLARKMTSVPYSVVFHFPPALVPHRYREFERWGFRRGATHLIAVSRATAQEVEQWAGRPCAVISHGVDSKRFRADPSMRARTREELGIGSDGSVLISVAALEERKGIQWGIKAMSQLLQENRNTHYLIIGDGPHKSQLRALVEDVGMQGNVHFLGAKSDVHPYLCASDIMLVLSKGEASSMSLLEALACELVAVTSRKPPFNELMTNAWGARVDEENTDQVAHTIASLLKARAARIKMGKAGRGWILQEHSWNQVAEQYIGLVGIG